MTEKCVCQMCGVEGAELYRQRTAYVDEASNWTTLCPLCRQENDAYWDEMWREYYASVL